MSAELPLSTRTRRVLKSAMVRLITKASSWGGGLIGHPP